MPVVTGHCGFGGFFFWHGFARMGQWTRSNFDVIWLDLLHGAVRHWPTQWVTRASHLNPERGRRGIWIGWRNCAGACDLRTAHTKNFKDNPHPDKREAVSGYGRLPDKKGHYPGVYPDTDYPDTIRVPTLPKRRLTKPHSTEPGWGGRRTVGW